jgi:hypothetical protein
MKCTLINDIRYLLNSPGACGGAAWRRGGGDNRSSEKYADVYPEDGST